MPIDLLPWTLNQVWTGMGENVSIVEVTRAVIRRYGSRVIWSPDTPWYLDNGDTWKVCSFGVWDLGFRVGIYPHSGGAWNVSAGCFHPGCIIRLPSPFLSLSLSLSLSPSLLSLDMLHHHNRWRTTPNLATPSPRTSATTSSVAEACSGARNATLQMPRRRYGLGPCPSHHHK
jgi:hypothetical protein